MGERIHYSKEGAVAILRMDDGKANAMQAEFFDQLNAALDRASAEQTGAVVITGRERFFSGGMDLKTLPTLGPEALAQVREKLLATMERVFLFPKPVVAASGGHAIAGGMVLYCTADYRIAVDDDSHKYGLNETALGIPLPGVFSAIPAGSIPPAHQMEMIVQARMITPKQSYEFGLSQELVPDAPALRSRALEKASELARLNAAAYAATKLSLRMPALTAARECEKRLHEGGQLPGGNLFSSVAK